MPYLCGFWRFANAYITVKGKEIAEKELIRLRELVGIASGIVGGTL